MLCSLVLTLCVCNNTTEYTLGILAAANRIKALIIRLSNAYVVQIHKMLCNSGTNTFLEPLSFLRSPFKELSIDTCIARIGYAAELQRRTDAINSLNNIDNYIHLHNFGIANAFNVI